MRQIPKVGLPRLAAVFVLAFTASTALMQGASTLSPIADAAERGQSELVGELLQRGSDPNGPQVDGMTALHWAAYQDDLSATGMLVRAGADVGAENRYGVTPLSLACENGSAGLIEMLLEAGANPNTALRGGETPLMTASRTGRISAVRILLAFGAEVGTKEDMRGQTALMWAAAEGHAQVVRQLIAAGANIEARLASGFTPLLFAVREGQLEAVKELLSAGADPNDWIRPPTDSLSQARGYSGAPPYGASALLIAVENAHYEVAAKLLDSGADPNAAKPGYTVLHAIARVRKPGMGDNDPPPHGSGTMTDIEFVKDLVSHGANLEARMTKKVNLGNTRLNKLEATPYFLAAQSADAELMRTLAALGADPLARNADNSTPLMAAAGLGTRSPGEDAGTEPEVLEAVEAALELGADINATDDNGETVMHAAAYKNLSKVVEYLAVRGADITVWNRPNRYGWTPLAIATGYRFGNFKPSPVTIDALRRVMIANGVIPPDKVEAKTQQIY